MFARHGMRRDAHHCVVLRAHGVPEICKSVRDLEEVKKT